MPPGAAQPEGECKSDGINSCLAWSHCSLTSGGLGQVTQFPCAWFKSRRGSYLQQAPLSPELPTTLAAQPAHLALLIANYKLLAC